MTTKQHSFVMPFLAVVSSLAIVIPVLVLIEMKSPWQPAMDVLSEKYPGQTYIPVGFRVAKEPGGFRETTYLVVPRNVTATISKAGQETTYNETAGGLYPHIAAMAFLVGVLVFVGIPQLGLFLMSRGLGKALAKNPDLLAARPC